VGGGGGGGVGVGVLMRVVHSYLVSFT
jgi:hypothetical protein